jgi:hypothetical protein
MASMSERAKTVMNRHSLKNARKVLFWVASQKIIIRSLQPRRSGSAVGRFVIQPDVLQRQLSPTPIPGDIYGYQSHGIEIQES